MTHAFDPHRSTDTPGAGDAARRHDAQLRFRALAAGQMARATIATHVAAGLADPAGRRPATAARKPLRTPAPVPARSAQVLLVEDRRGLLHWQYEAAAPGIAARGSGLRRRSPLRSAATPGLQVLARAEVAEIGPNRITAALQALDDVLTPQQGLRLMEPGTFALEPAGRHRGRLATAQRVLVFVHGTFSSGEMFADELRSTPRGADFLQRAFAHYGHVAAFDHPTLGVSPLLNALDLDAALQEAGLPMEVPVDIVCHSRGGLVASWWLRHTRRVPGAWVSVAAPLGGTSLASPYRVNHFLDYLANYARLASHALKAVASVPVVPPLVGGLLAGASGLAGIFGGVLGVASALPVADAGIALVPGLHGMSRVTNNAELRRLWPGGTPAAGVPPSVRSYTVTADFEPSRGHPWWDLWNRLKSLPWQAANGAMDQLFPGPNDLVVDTGAMAIRGATERLEFAASEVVHHCNYFTQPRTVAALGRWLQVP